MNRKSMKRRIFVAINLPEKTKKRLAEFKEKHDHLPARWTKEASLHLTLVFIGYVSDEQMLEVCKATRKVAEEFDPFFINFKRIVFGPPGKEPRLIWLEGEENKELVDLKNKLEEVLLETDSGLRRKESRAANPHITLARIKIDQWRSLPQAPKIQNEFLAQVPVSGIEVMESDLKSDGAEYIILESMSLEGN
jgi:2'-5' RNA ligase